MTFLDSRTIEQYRDAFLAPTSRLQSRNVRCLSLSVWAGPGETPRLFRTVSLDAICASFANLRELHATYTRCLVDEELAALLSGLPSLQVLVLQDLRDVPEMYGYGDKDLSTSIAQIASGLPSLQHLWLEGLHGNSMPIYGSPSVKLEQVALMYCDIAPDMLFHLLQPCSTK